MHQQAKLSGKRVHALVTFKRRLRRPVAANDHIQIALIGAGGQGMGDTKAAVQVPGVKLVAVADCYNGRLERSKELWGDDVFTTRDYNEILARKDIDAVIIGTPDHWHKQASVDAMKAGKDVYCEKPMIHLYSDGPEMIETAKTTNRIIQVGSQRVSSVLYAKAKELLASGAIGELNMVTAYWDRNSSMGAWNYTIPPDASPETCDWPRFLGTAPKIAVQRGAVFSMAQVEGIWERRGRRPVCASFQRDALCYRSARTNASHGNRGASLLEGWTQRAGRDAGALRLQRGIQPESARQFCRWRRREREADVSRALKAPWKLAGLGFGESCSA